MSASWWTSPDYWQAIGQMISAFGVLLIIAQLYKARKTDENQTRWQIEQVSFSVYRTFIEFPALRPYFYSGISVPENDHALKNQVDAACEMLLDYFETIIVSTAEVDDQTETAWLAYMRSIYAKSAELKRFLREHDAQYSAALKQKLTSP